MAFDVSTFRAKMQGGGARSNLFRVRIGNPPNAANMPTEEVSFMVKASSLPGSTVGVIEVPYFGHKIKVAGDREYEEWNTTIINDEDFDVRDALQRWSSAMASHSSANEAKRQLGSTANPFSYVANAFIDVFGKDGQIIKTETMVNAWPSLVGQIELAWESENQIQEFECSWQFDFMQSDVNI